MPTPRNPAAAGIPRLAAGGLALLGLSALLGACGSGAPAAAGAAASPAVVHATCTQVSAVLSDGPDPAADPVGYAEAQVLPLRQIHTKDAQLKAAISKLDSAYRAFFASNGSSRSAKLAVATASKRIDSFCPGAAA